MAEKDPNRACPDCGKTPYEVSFGWAYNKRTGHERRVTYCRECHNKRTKKYRKLCNLELRYGLTAGQPEMMLKSQKGLCDLCGLPLNGDLVVDHNHATEKVRGLLHRLCNLKLGIFEDKLFLSQALAYLAKHK